MRRARSTDNSDTVSLFPFLAVLLCTMGSLIVLLVVLSHQAKVQAAQKAASARESAAQRQKEPLEAYKRQSDHLKPLRTAAAENLSTDRLELSHLEDHMRRIAQRLARLQEAAEQLRAAKESNTQNLQQAEAEVARIQSLVAETAKQLEEDRREARGRRRSYSVIPYQGTSKTLRRPIYIECREDSVVLQPEGVTLKAEDFQRPLGPGNPLAAALRAAREYYHQTDVVASETASYDPLSEPYPLILIRPGGITAYYEVRNAIESWGSDFGYELVEQDWQLEFPLPNPQLARAERHAVELARARRKRLARVAPSRYGRRTRPTYRATSRRGGFQLESGGPFDEETGSGSGSFVSRRANEPFGGARRQWQTNGSGGGSGNESSPGATSGYDLTSTKPQERAQRDGSAPFSGEQFGSGQPGSGQPGSGQPGSGQPVGEQPGGEQPVGEQPGGEQPVGEQPFGGQRDGEQRDGEQSFGGQPIEEQPAGGQSVGGRSGARSSASGAAGGVGDSLADRRGQNWALPSRRSDAVPISRPVRVVCRSDRLAILPDEGLREGTVIRLDESTEEAVDEFVSALWDHMRTWGIAGRGLYWRPVLELHVGPGGGPRAADLRRLLKNSGLEVRDARVSDRRGGAR